MRITLDLVYNIRTQQLRRWAARQGTARSVLGYFAGYAIWIAAFKFISLTFITYFVLTTATHGARFEDVNDAYGASALPTFALCSLSFVLLERLLHPLRPNAAAKELFTPQRFEKRFLPGFLHGGVLASGVILAFLFSGIYRYLGFFVHFDEAPFALASIVLRVASVGVLAYCEEYIFRGKILKKILADSDSRTVSTSLLATNPQADQSTRQLAAVGAVSLLYLIAKLIQFAPGLDLGWMSGITVVLISVNLGVRACVDRDFTYGAGFWAAVLIVFHPLMSLPIFGSEFAGLILIKYQAATTLTGLGGGDVALLASDTTRFFTGGAGGPLAAFAFQILMAFDIARNALRYKKVMAHPSYNSIGNSIGNPIGTRMHESGLNIEL
jgi:hypothetical protein